MLHILVTTLSIIIIINLNVAISIKFRLYKRSIAFINNAALNNNINNNRIFSKRYDNTDDEDFDYYKILSLDRNCTLEDINEKYKSINDLLSTMPTVDPKLKSSIDKAYQVLSNQDSRAEYDQMCEGADESDEFTVEDDAVEFSLFDDEEEEEEEEESGNLWSKIFGFKEPRTKRTSRKNKETDITITQDVDLKTLVFGDTLNIPVERWTLCENCNPKLNKSFLQSCNKCKGTGFETKNQRTPFGYISSSRSCATCNGSGVSRKKDCVDCNNTAQIYAKEECQVVVPPGTKSGTVIKLKGCGHFGGQKTGGNLFVRVVSRYNSQEYIKDKRIITIFKVSYIKMITGAEVTVPTFNGAFKIKIPEGSQNGDEIHVDYYNNMEHVVKLHVILPQTPSQHELELLKKINDSN